MYESLTEIIFEAIISLCLLLIIVFPAYKDDKNKQRKINYSYPKADANVIHDNLLITIFDYFKWLIKQF